MPSLVYVLISPLLLLISVPLVVSAVFTTFAAFSTLYFRVLLVYAELAIVLLRNQTLNHRRFETSSPLPKGANSPHSQSVGARAKGRNYRSPIRSSSGSSVTPKAVEINGLGVYSGGGLQRDFEGVGGWRIPSSEGEDMLWTSMNSRLKLPVPTEIQHRHHRRSVTSGCASPTSLLTSSSLPQHERATPPLRTPETVHSRQGFADRQTSKSTSALIVENPDRMMLGPRQSSSTFSFEHSFANYANEGSR